MYKSICGHLLLYLFLTILMVYVFFLKRVFNERFMARILELSHRTSFDQKQINTGDSNSTNQGFHSNDSPDAADCGVLIEKTLPHWNLINFIISICIYRQFTVMPILKDCFKRLINLWLELQILWTVILITYTALHSGHKTKLKAISQDILHWTLYISCPIVFPIWYKTSKILVQTHTH